MNPVIRYAGDRAMLVCPASRDELTEVVATLAETELAGIEDVLPAAETVLVTVARGFRASEVEQVLRTVLAAPRTARRSAAEQVEEVTIAVRYDGADLADVAELLDLSIEQLIAEHTGRVWRCRFLGFTAGFGYLDPDRPGLTVPRRDQSRTAVPAGSVALADGFSAVYPRRAPGGWQLIGTTDASMWDLRRPRPSLLQPGSIVRFVQEDR